MAEERGTYAFAIESVSYTHLDVYKRQVNDRYNRSTLLHPRPTLVTSNFRRGELPRMISEGGAGLAIASRLSETTEAVEMGGPDRRLP